MSQIGFVLITHSKPRQIKRLVTRLNTMFDSPPIVIHHDFDKCPLAEDLLPGNVSFVRPHAKTGWGQYSIIEATLLGMAQLYRLPNAPDWCEILSGACYPIKSAAHILAELTDGVYDAYINGRKVGLDFLTSDWHRERFDRYCVKRLPIPSVDKHLRPKTRAIPLPDIIGRHLLPFDKSFQCYGGGHWFTANRRASDYILAFQETPRNIALTNHYRDINRYQNKVRFPEESYFQTVLYNAPQFKIQHGNLRYIDWSEHNLHPKQLTLADLTEIQASTAHFARKIDIDTDADLLDALDQIIDRGEPFLASTIEASIAQ